MPTVRDIVEFLGRTGETTLVPPSGSVGDQAIVGVERDQEAGSGDLAWLSPKQAQREPARMAGFRGSLLIVPAGMVQTGPTCDAVVVPCVNPKLAFIHVVRAFFAALATTVWPGPADRGILAGTRLGERLQLAPGVVLGSRVTLGDDVVVGPNSCLANCTVASGVTIGANCTIGLPGFGYEKDAAGIYWRFPHIGRVVIERDVEIGSNVCIDRGAIGDTTIGQGSKIDNLVHVAHNVTIGRNVLVIANSMIGGSTAIDDGGWIAPSASLMNQIRIGRGAVVGLGAVVTKDVPADAVVAGNPAKPLERKGTT